MSTSSPTLRFSSSTAPRPSLSSWRTGRSVVPRTTETLTAMSCTAERSAPPASPPIVLGRLPPRGPRSSNFGRSTRAAVIVSVCVMSLLLRPFVLGRRRGLGRRRIVAGGLALEHAGEDARDLRQHLVGIALRAAMQPAHAHHAIVQEAVAMQVDAAAKGEVAGQPRDARADALDDVVRHAHLHHWIVARDGEGRTDHAEDLLGAAAAHQLRQQSVEDDVDEALAVLGERGEHLFLPLPQTRELLGERGERRVRARLGFGQRGLGALDTAVLAALAHAFLVAELARRIDIGSRELQRIVLWRRRRVQIRQHHLAVEWLLRKDAVEDEAAGARLAYVAHAAPSVIQFRMMPAASSGLESTISPTR